MTTSARTIVIRSRTTGQPSPGRLEKTAAVVTIVSLGMRVSIYAGITVGVALAVLLSPVWRAEVNVHRGARLLFATGATALVWGLGLTWVSSGSHALNQRQVISDCAFLVQLLVGVGAVYWARRVLGILTVGVAFAIGMLLQGLLLGAEGTGNPWKALWAVPVAIIVLSILYGRQRHVLDLIALLALAVASGLLDSRSYGATFLIGAVLKLWQMRPAAMSKRRSYFWNAFLIGGVGFFAYQLGQQLLVAGYLGANAQQRTVAQIQQSGSLIYGGRPELKATLALMRDDIWGHGVGVIASYHDILVAKSAMSAVIYNPNNGYVEKFMFGNDVELHSVFGDLWTHFGLAGLALFFVLGSLTIRTLVRQVADRVASGLVLFLGCWTLWNLFFSPFYSAIPTLTLLLGFGLPEIAARAQAAGLTVGAQPSATATN